MIIDTHVHVVAGDEQRYPLQPPGVGGQWYLEPDLDVESYRARMAGAGVDAAVLVQAFGAYGYDNRYVLDAARSDPAHLAGVCIVDVHAPAAAEALRRLVLDHGATGLRLFALRRPGDAQPDWLDDPVTFPLWEEARALAICIVVTAFASQLPRLGVVLSRFPDVQVLLDHSGFVDPASSAPELLALAPHANLHLKVTSHLLEVAPGGGREFVSRLATAFGSRRLLWGSDHPQTHDRPYAELVELGRTACGDLPPADQALFLGGNAHRLWPGLLADDR